MTTETFRILWIRAAIMTPPADPALSPPAHLSPRVHGDYLAAWSVDDSATAEALYPTLGSYFGRFRFHYVRRLRWPTPFRQLREIAFYAWRGLRLARRQRYDAVVAYGLYATGYSAWLVSRLTRTPLVLELSGHPWKGFAATDGGTPGLKARLAPLFARFLLRRADHVRLLYPTQIPPELTTSPSSVFHDFVPVSSIPRGPEARRERYIVLIGSPLYLKGADLLITAFRRVADNFPGWTLRVIGHAPDYAPFEKLAGGDPRIELLGPVPHSQTLKLLRGASLMVHPSRTEAMGRVLLEAMASGTPILASRVDGIPHYVRDGETGMLFDTEDVDDLERKLRGLLTDQERAWRLADAAFRYVHEELDEQGYVRHFCEMLEIATGSRTGRRTSASATAQNTV